MGTQKRQVCRIKRLVSRGGTDEDEEYVEYSDYSSDYICPRTLIYLIPNTSLGAELTGVKISRM